MIPQAVIDQALRALGIERLVLSIHDVSFPGRAGEDVGRGSPLSEGGRDFLRFARELGFGGVLFGPQGQTSRGNPSPYDGSVFSKSVLSVALADLTTPRFGCLLTPEEVAALAAGAPAGDSRAHYTYAFDAVHGALAVAAARGAQRVADRDAAALALEAAVQAFAARSPWLEHDATFEAFAGLHGTDDFTRWPARDQSPDEARVAEVNATFAGVRAAYVLGQYIVHAQHRFLREEVTGPLGLLLYGDLQVGLSLRDRWRRGALFLPRYRMGAPPSRTNPEGQPWGYPVFDPRQYQARFVGLGAPRAPLRFAQARIEKLFAELDCVRVDHPHGLVCPWVYDGDAPDAMEAVVNGARLFETPESAEHPSLATFAIAEASQIDRSVPAYDDDRVRGLRAAQVDAYDVFFGAILDAARAAGRGPADVLCEVLSTCPEPLAEIMDRHGLGRFRVTQKASLTNPADGYRGENAGPRDWTMLGNHDTPPLPAVIARWAAAGTIGARAAYLATRLEPAAERREAFAASLAADPGALAQAMFAELFVGPASNVLVFFADLFGEHDTYNTPGLVSEANWSMRVPRAFRDVYGERVGRRQALSIPRALAAALRAKGPEHAAAHRELLARLDEAP
ncbi:MAG: hypothetical protein JWP97_5729 [Labilithrix sp.]|nr:hypothetical protein [Labilithrix sp.]